MTTTFIIPLFVRNLKLREILVQMQLLPKAPDFGNLDFDNLNF